MSLTFSSTIVQDTGDADDDQKKKTKCVVCTRQCPSCVWMDGTVDRHKREKRENTDIHVFNVVSHK